MNKTIKTLLYCGLLLCAPGAGAQPAPDGGVRVSNLSVSRADSNLFVWMDIDVSTLELGSNQEVILTPVLVGDSASLPLLSVSVAGRNRYFHHLRNGDLPQGLRLYRHGETPLIECRSAIPYRRWMGGAALELDTETRACGEATIGQRRRRLDTLELEPEVPAAYVPALVYLAPKTEPKVQEIKGSAFIDFPVNRTEIHADYRSNPAELQKIRNTIDAVKNDPDARIVALTIKGYASPEGPYANNARLAEGRTGTLKEYVRRLYDFPQELFTTAYEPEDWQGLERFVEGSELKNRAAILDIIRSGREPDAKEWKIKSSYPADYAYLLANVYPGLRHSDYTVRYEIREFTDAEQIKRLLRTAPGKLSLQEMYLAAQTLEPGSDEYNEVFEIAVRMFPEDEAANLNAANTAMGRGDLPTAQRRLAKAGDSAEAVYARGVCAALAEDYDTAARLFGEARQQGIPEAEEALREVEAWINYHLNERK